jgi:ribosomal protein S4
MTELKPINLESHDDNETTTNTENLTFKYVEWKEEHEKILVEWADKAMCYRWLHSKSHQRYSSKHAWYTIPVIIMSTLTGTANFAQDKFPPEYKSLAQMAIGAVNIFAGILTTIAQFLKIGELNESHRVSAISWDKFYRNIKVELAKSPEERMHVNQMLKICKEEFDRLMETSPTINDIIIDLFKHTFTSNKTGHLLSDKKQQLYINFAEINKPEICDELISTESFRYKAPEIDETVPKINPALNEAAKKKKINDAFETEVRNFINNFKQVHKRTPTSNEIIDNLQDKISTEMLIKIIQRLETLNEINTGENKV